jgi:hypothetical protein
MKSNLPARPHEDVGAGVSASPVRDRMKSHLPARPDPLEEVERLSYLVEIGPLAERLGISEEEAQRVLWFLRGLLHHGPDPDLPGGTSHVLFLERSETAGDGR